jgi:chaperonin cofactor prefoldin
MKLFFKILSIFLVMVSLAIWFILRPNTELDKMTNSEIKEYFYKHKSILNDIVDVCRAYPSIERIDKDSFKFYKEGLATHSQDRNKAVKETQKTLKDIKAGVVQCSRLKEILNNELLGVSILLYSAGLGVSGEAQSLDYDTEEDRKLQEKRKRVEILWETKTPIEDGWSIVYMK